MKSSQILPTLLRSIEENRLHHALLFTGSDFQGKVNVVEELLAQLSVGAVDMFGAPPSAEQILSKVKRGHHPDLLKIKKSEDSISVDDVRVLGRALSFAPLEAKKRIVLIENAEAMNAQAANAVLKVLEEPPHHTMFFLLCRDSAELMPTILSRCQELRFAPPSAQEVLESLRLEFPDVSPRFLDIANAIADGSVDRAKDFLKLENSQELFQSASEQILNAWEKSPKIPSSMVQWAESLTDQEEVSWVVNIWEALLRDLSILCAQPAGDLLFPEFRVRILKLLESPLIHAESVTQKKTSINRFRVYRELNGNLKLDFLNLICDLNFSVGKSHLPV